MRGPMDRGERRHCGRGQAQRCWSKVARMGSKISILSGLLSVPEATAARSAAGDVFGPYTRRDSSARAIKTSQTWRCCTFIAWSAARPGGAGASTVLPSNVVADCDSTSCRISWASRLPLRSKSTASNAGADQATRAYSSGLMPPSWFWSGRAKWGANTDVSDHGLAGAHAKSNNSELIAAGCRCRGSFCGVHGVAGQYPCSRICASSVDDRPGSTRGKIRSCRHATMASRTAGAPSASPL